MKIRTIIVDDERKALEILKNKIERSCPQLDIVASTQSPSEAISLINTLQPDLVFLDVSMPELTGFDVLTQLTNLKFELIFATAFDQYAIEAIKHCAIGYLVKPIDNEELALAVNNSIKNIQERTALQKNTQLLNNLNLEDKKMAIPSLDGLDFVKIKDIIYCEGVDGYTNVYLSDKRTFLSSNSIGHFRKLLENQKFYLTHKSYLINLDYIEKYLNEGYVQLSGGITIPVSRNKRQAFLNMLKN